MSDGRKTKLKEPMQDVELPKVKLEVESEAKPETPLTAEQIYLKRKAEVAQQDNEGFSAYLREKAARDEQQTPQPAPAQTAPLPQTAPRKLNRRSLLTWAAGTAVVGEAITLGYPMLTGQSIPDHLRQARRLDLYRTSAPPHRSRTGQSAGRCGRATLRRLGPSDAHQVGRRHLCGEPEYRPGARLDFVLELRRLQPDLASPVRLPERGPGEGLRMDQQHARRQEFPDLRHPHPDRDAGRRLQHLSRALRRLANGGDGERRGNDGAWSRRAREHRSQDRGALFRHRRAEGHRGVLRPPDLARDRGAQIRLGAQRPQPGRGLAKG